jgi:hypothetical protein
MASRLSDCLVRDGTLPRDVVRAATARQAVYGGALDTALLELGALDEPALWSALATATGAPIPDAALFEHPDPAAAMLFDVTWSRRCRAVPVGQHDGALQLCCSEPVDDAQLEAAEAALGVPFEIFVVPEVRLAAARQAVYGELMSPRLLRVLARLLGAQPVRKWVKALEPATTTATAAPAPPAPAGGGRDGEDAVKKDGPSDGKDDGELAEAEFDVPVNTYTTEPADIIESRVSSAKAADEVARALAAPEAAAAPASAPAEPAPDADDAKIPPRVFRTPVALSTLEVRPGQRDEQEHQMCLVADDPESPVRLATLRLLRARLDHGRVRALADKLRDDLAGPAERAVPAAGALGELRDATAVPALIGALDGPPSLARTAARALVEIAKQDFGQSRKKWLVWWEAHKDTDRVTWLLEGLSHKAPEIRFSASEELRLITGEYFGYHFDLPKREREEAKERWQQWWYQSNPARSPDRR